MEFLSLEDPVEVPTVRVSRSEAILLSLGLHLLLVLLFLFGPGVASRVLPESILALLGAPPPTTRALDGVPEDANKTAAERENRHTGRASRGAARRGARGSIRAA